ncbi:MAG: hypothetical protein AAGD43_16320 [Pseudomonadota bacterium]
MRFDKDAQDMINGSPRWAHDRARDIMLNHTYAVKGDSSRIQANFMELEFEIREAIKSAVEEQIANLER